MARILGNTTLNGDTQSNRNAVTRQLESRISEQFLTSHEVSAQLLLPFNSFEQRLEVPCSEAGEVVPLNNLNEHGGTIHQML